MAVQTVMDREGEDTRRASEKVADRLPPLEAAESGAFPNRVLGEQTRNPLGIVLVVAQGRIAHFKVADCFPVLQHLQSPLNPFEPCRIKSIVLRRICPRAVSRSSGPRR